MTHSPAITQKKKRDCFGKRYQINLGYSDDAKRLYDQCHLYKQRLGFETATDTAEGMLQQIGPGVPQKKKRTKEPKVTNFLADEAKIVSDKTFVALQAHLKKKIFKNDSSLK